MKQLSLVIPLFLALAASRGLGAQQPDIAYFVVPVEDATRLAALNPDPSNAVYFPMLRSNLAEGILYYVEPMDKKIKSYVPKKDSMGMDYPAVHVDQSTRRVLFFVDPADRKVTSPGPKKNTAGQDYLPVYGMRVFEK